MNARTLCGLVLVGIALGMTIGCGPPVVVRPATFQVTGTVTLDGSPVEGAAVSFVPAPGGTAAAGTTDASGKYTLTTFEGGDGALPGEYSVKIAKYEGGPVATGTASEGDEGMMTAEYDAQAQGQETDDAGPKNLLPEKYNDESTSELKATVTEGTNSFDFVLEK
jgi:hypothetical protein